MGTPEDASATPKGRSTRAQILDAAMEHFAENGYRASSLREIASKCGLSHPGLLYHFPTKEALLLAVLERRDELDGEHNPTAGVAGLEALRNLVGVMAHNVSVRGIVELFATLSAEATAPDHPAHDYFQRRYASLLAQIEGAYTEAAADGCLREDVDPHAAALEAIALMDGLQVQWLLGAYEVPMSAILRRHFETQLTVEL